MSDIADAFLDYDDHDPALTEGYHVIYNREVPMEIRHSSSQSEVSSNAALESIKVKIAILGSEEQPTSINVELSSEVDLFFYYFHLMDESNYQKIKTSQSLIADYGNYASILIRMLNSCIREPYVYLAVYTITGEDTAKLDFIQNMEYKYVELLSCAFLRCPIEVVQNQITYRYNAVKAKLTTLQSRMQDIINVVKTKNPSLLLQLQKASTNSSATNIQSNGAERYSQITERRR
jgi:hypothetical protein